MGVSTLIIGLGGKGGEIVERIARKATYANANDVEFVVMDTDINDLRRLHNANPRITTIQTSYRSTVGGALDNNKEASERWFPVSPGLLGKSLTEGAGQVRSISRLAFDHAVANGKMRPLEKAIERLRSLRGDPYEQSIRVMICASLVGGTGSGIALPVAMYVRNFLLTRYQDQSAIIRGFFLEPDTFFGKITDAEEQNNLRCNAYAFIREIDAFLRKQYLQDSEGEYRHVVFNAPQPGTGKRVDYPNILPFDYVFLMDSMNLDGEHLPELENYIDHMADVIFNQSIGVASSKSNSAEDNFTRRLDRSKGRARYCGAGCSHLVYPYEEVRRYFGLSWASSAITSEWLELDHLFQREVREGNSDGSAIDRAKSFVQNFDLLRKQNKFFTVLGKESKFIEKTTNENGMPVEREVAIGGEYVRKLLAYANAWNGNPNGLTASCGALEAFSEMTRHIDEPLVDKRDVEVFAADMGDSWVTSLERICADYDDSNNRYFHIVSSDIADTARIYARRLFRTPESDVNPLEMLRESHYIESFIGKKEGSGAKHPLVVRYILNDAFVQLTAELERINKDINGKERGLSQKYDSTEQNDDAGIRREEAESVPQWISQKLREIKDKTPATDSQIADAVSIGDDLVERRQSIEVFRQLTVQRELVSAALDHIAALSEAYLGFFNYMEGQIPLLEESVQAIEEDARFNPSLGDKSVPMPTRYVCASKECLRGMYNACPQAGSSADLPPELCADIYRGVIRFMSLSHDGQTYNERNEAGNAAFSELFKRTVIDFWTMRLEDPALGYQSVVDKGVLRAILDEKRYLDPDGANNPVKGEELLRGYLIDVLDEAHDLAKPYIMRPLEPEGEERPSTFRSCAYDPSIISGLGAYGTVAKNHLASLGGQAFENGEISPHELLFYRSVYGFRAAHLVHYSCEHHGNESRSAGEYHTAYWAVANELSPDPKRNTYITPHIDRHWHLISYLPDISDDYQRELYNKVIRAFVFGLASRQFRMIDSRDSPMSFALKTASGQRQVELIVPNGTKCDRFYEVFEALLFDPQIVAQIIERSERSRKDEERIASPHMEDSHLVKMVKSSVAVGTMLSDEQVTKRIDAYLSDAEALRGGKALDENARLEYLAGRVIDLFGVSSKSAVELERVKHSLFEIPLYYQLSLPPSELRPNDVENMVDGIYACVKDYLSRFTSVDGIATVCARFMEEQYRRFEYNLPMIEQAFPGAAWSLAAQTTRDKMLSFDCFDRFDEDGKALEAFCDSLDAKWKEVSTARDALMRKLRIEQDEGESA